MTDFTGRTSPSKTLIKLPIYVPSSPPAIKNFQVGIAPPAIVTDGAPVRSTNGFDGLTEISGTTQNINGVQVTVVTYPGGTYFW